MFRMSISKNLLTTPIVCLSFKGWKKDSRKKVMFMMIKYFHEWGELNQRKITGFVLAIFGILFFATFFLLLLNL
jgi:hypothetical protein